MKIRRLRKGLDLAEVILRRGRKLADGTRSQLLAQLQPKEEGYAVYESENPFFKENATARIAHYIKIMTQREMRRFPRPNFRLLGYFALGPEVLSEIFEEVEEDELFNEP